MNTSIFPVPNCDLCDAKKYQFCNMINGDNLCVCFRHYSNGIKSQRDELLEACKWAKSIVSALGDAEEIHGEPYINLCNAINKAEGKK